MSTRIGQGCEEDLTRKLFHLLDRLPKFSLVLDGLLHRRELWLTERNGDGFLSPLSRPLVSASTRGSHRACQDRSLANVTGLREAFAQAIVLFFQSGEGGASVFHGAYFKRAVKPAQ